MLRLIFKGSSIKLDLFFCVILSRMYSRTFMYSCSFVRDFQRERLLGSYVYVIGISYNKMYLYLGRSKWIQGYHEILWNSFSSDSIEDMKTAQRASGEKLKTGISISRSTLLIYRDLMNLNTYLNLSSWQFLEYSLQCFILIDYLFMGLCKPNRNMRAYLKGSLNSYLNKVVEKESPKTNAS